MQQSTSFNQSHVNLVAPEYQLATYAQRYLCHV